MNEEFKYLPIKKVLQIREELLDKHRCCIIKSLDQLKKDLKERMNRDEYEIIETLTDTYWSDVLMHFNNYEYMFFSFLSGKDMGPFLMEIFSKRETL